MSHEYFRNTDRIEFIVTMACTGRCKHCSEGDHVNCKGHIDQDIAVDAIRKICGQFKIRSLMTFGGEPLLYPEVVCAIHRTATEMGIPERQLITNGFFSKDKERIGKVVRELSACGVNEILLSVDAFHQETIPLEPVRYFAECVVKAQIPVKFSPAWLVSREDNNPYNVRTREILAEFDDLTIPTGSGNVIFPSGNALKYLKEYLDENIPNPYEEDPADIRSIAFSENGDVLNGNVYETDILEILEEYHP
ncbi:MAG: radical SAM protein [Clostridiales bacterium]|nr:radical SAM protein [Clostridiales bacterium]